jgi:thymidylate synthase
MNKTNEVWKNTVEQCLTEPDYVANPRGMEVREVINGSYTVPMPAYIDLADRNINLPFMFKEAAWIISGSNRTEEIAEYMSGYSKYSDDGTFLRGAYGPKVVDQLSYVVETLKNDNDSRQAYLNIWRERPGPSKDIPCTVGMQFLLRENELNMIATMRSQDVVLGYTYDVFTFSMVAETVRRLLRVENIQANLGRLSVNAGSMHLYSNFYDKAAKWIESDTRDLNIGFSVTEVLNNSDTYMGLIKDLEQGAKNAKVQK